MYRMKKYLIPFLIIFVLHKVNGQSVSYLPTRYTEILIYSVSFSYSSGGSYSYSRPSFSYANVLSTLQARYDHNLATISKEYYKLKDLELINKSNQVTLQQYKNQRLDWIYKVAPTYDLGDESNSNKVLEYCCEIYSYPSIKKEITLLQKCNTELERIKYADPNGYPLSKRYRSISKVLEKLSTCLPEEIGKLNWESIEIEENTLLANKAAITSNANAYVSSSTMNVRSGASTSSAIITTMKKGDKVEIIEKVNEKWTKVKVKYFDNFSNTDNTATGYVSSALLTSVNPYKDIEDQYAVLQQILSPYGKDMGKIVFYTSCNNDGEIMIYIDGGYIGTLNKSFSAASPDCNSAGTISAIKPAGTYKYIAKGTNLKWQGEFTISVNQCSLQHLSK